MCDPGIRQLDGRGAGIVLGHARSARNCLRGTCLRAGDWSPVRCPVKAMDGAPPSIAIVGNLCNLGYEFARAFHEAGREARLLATPRDAADWHRVYPDRDPAEEPLIHLVGTGRWTGYASLARQLRRYDVVFSVALGAMQVLPWCRRPYVSYATGSDLRELAAGLDQYARRQAFLARHTFRHASHVFYSPDLKQVLMLERLRLNKATPWRQLVDVDYWARTAAPTASPTQGIVLFHPTSQIWMPRFEGQTLKRNDILFTGFAMFLERGGRGRLQYLHRGQDADRTAQLVQDLGISDHVEVVGGDMSRNALRELYGCADVVADQFETGIGLIALEAMAAARPVIGYLDSTLAARTYAPPDRPPPLLSATHPREVCRALEQLADDEERHRVGREAQLWVRKHHAVDLLANWYLQRIDMAARTADA
jgi:glycosyltransferase involved in cell wall biosynthesis